MARILIVDDVKFISRLLSDLLARRGHRTQIANDGVEALETALADPPDLVLLDITMPRMNGLDVARVLKSDPVTANVPILMITSRRDETAVRTAIEIGVEDFLTKPFDDELLLERVDAQLDRRPAEATTASEDGVAIFTAPRGAPSAEWEKELCRAVDASSPEPPEAVVVDLSRLEGIGPEMADVILAVRAAAARAGAAGRFAPRLEIVRPGGVDLRTRLAVARIERQVPVHEDRETALTAVRSSATTAGSPVDSEPESPFERSL